MALVTEHVFNAFQSHKCDTVLAIHFTGDVSTLYIISETRNFSYKGACVRCE